MSATGSDPRSDTRACVASATTRTGVSARPASHAGFTLVEVIVAFAIAGLLLAVVPMALGKAVEGMRYRGLVGDIVGDLRSARTHAMLSGREVRFEIDLPARRIGVGERIREVPDGLVVDAVLADAEIESPGKGAIRFYPDGSATGGSISVVRENSGSGVRVRVDWLLGRVSQEPLNDKS